MSEVKDLSNEALIKELKSLLQKDATLEAELLLFLGEVDFRRLYLDQACSSMFVYCTQVLGLGEACACHRIRAARAARAAREFSAILDEVRKGRLHVSGISLIAKHLTLENHRDWLAAARGKSKRALCAGQAIFREGALREVSTGE